MSRIAPSIPVDLNSRRVLVESFASRVPRCDCCPEVLTCHACPQGDLSIRLDRMTRFIPADRFHPDVTVTDWTITSINPRVGCSDAGRILRAAPLDAPLIGPLPPSLGFGIRGIPDGGILRQSWTWESLLVLSGSHEAFLFGPARTTVTIRLHTFIVEDNEGLEGVWYFIGIYNVSQAIQENVAEDGWFEQGFLGNAVPCRPDIFPVVLNLSLSQLPSFETEIVISVGLTNA